MTAIRKVWRRGPLLGVAALAMALTACGSGGAGTQQSPQTPQGPSTQGGSAQSAPSSHSIGDLVAAANQEGAVSWYTATADKDTAPVVAAFNKDYPDIKVTTLRLSADKLPARVLTEQKGGKYTADVVSGNSSYVAQLIQADALQPYDPPDAVALPAGLDLPDGYHGVTYVQTTVIAYNPTVVKEKGLSPPTSWEDLTKPEWKGQFSVNPGAVDWYNSLVSVLGHDKALQLAQDLGKNAPRLVESHSQALTQVQSGEPVAAAMVYGHDAEELKAKDPQTIAYMNANPLPSSLNLIDLAKNAPHPNAARVFLDWMESQAGQQAVIDASGYISLRSDVGNEPAVWNPDTWKPAWSPPNMDPKTFNQRVKELKDAFNAP